MPKCVACAQYCSFNMFTCTSCNNRIELALIWSKILINFVTASYQILWSQTHYFLRRKTLIAILFFMFLSMPKFDAHAQYCSFNMFTCTSCNNRIELALIWSKILINFFTASYQILWSQTHYFLWRKTLIAVLCFFCFFLCQNLSHMPNIAASTCLPAQAATIG